MPREEFWQRKVYFQKVSLIDATIRGMFWDGMVKWEKCRFFIAMRRANSIFAPEDFERFPDLLILSTSLHTMGSSRVP